MAHSVVTATDVADLFGELELFAGAQGWTVVWNTGSQIGLNNATGCYCALGVDGRTNPSPETDAYPDPDVVVSDFRIYGTVAKNFVGHASHYWGLTGSLVTSNQDQDRVFMNDLTGPFSEVHFFGDARYIWVVVRTDSDRWTHFGFGNFDKKGMTHPDCSFLCGIWWRWWDNTNQGGGGGTPAKRNMDYTSGAEANRPWMKKGYSNYNVYIADGVLDPAYGIADDVGSVNGISNLPELRGGRGFEVYTGYNDTSLMSHWAWARNKPVTGGLPLLTVPVLFGSGAGDGSSLTCFLGDFPGVRLCSVDNIPIAEDIVYGAETYLAFPLKRRTGETYDGKCGTYQFGVAFKKD